MSSQDGGGLDVVEQPNATPVGVAVPNNAAHITISWPPSPTQGIINGQDHVRMANEADCAALPADLLPLEDDPNPNISRPPYHDIIETLEPAGIVIRPRKRQVVEPWDSTALHILNRSLPQLMDLVELPQDARKLIFGIACEEKGIDAVIDIRLHKDDASRYEFLKMDLMRSISSKLARYGPNNSSSLPTQLTLSLEVL
jgi:hypothetical protein